MGEVYRAEDLRLGEPVALKFLPEKLVEDGAALARFHREVRTARLITHRNVVRVHDIGEVDGQPFLSMEYVDGEDLASLLRRIGRLPVGQGARARAPALRRARRRARARRAPSRSQARQRAGRRPGPRQDHRLRARRARLRSRVARARRHAGLHGARAARRRTRVVRERHLLARARALRDVHRAPLRSRATIAPGARAPAPERSAADVERSCRGSTRSSTKWCCAACGSSPNGGRSPRSTSRRRCRAAIRWRRRSRPARRRRPRWWRGAREAGTLSRPVALAAARSLRRRRRRGSDRDRDLVGGAPRRPAAAAGPRPRGALGARARRASRASIGSGTTPTTSSALQELAETSATTSTAGAPPPRRVRASSSSGIASRCSRSSPRRGSRGG